MRVKVIASSSSGNCYVLYGQDGALMIECGIMFKDIQKALTFDFSGIYGCLVSHEHGDHAKAAQDIVEAGIDVYSGYGTLTKLGIDNHYRSYAISDGNQVAIGEFTILPFATQHDAAEPLGFIIYERSTAEKLVFLTDTYYTKYTFVKPTYIMVECNYCLDILNENIASGALPEALKNRIVKSHFSLHNTKEMLKATDLSRCMKIILIHMSEGNADPERMVREVMELTEVDTVAAMPGMVIELKKDPF